MNRRGFLQKAAIAAAALAVDPERLLWTPGQKTIFIPQQKVVRTPLIINIWRKSASGTTTTERLIHAVAVPDGTFIAGARQSSPVILPSDVMQEVQKLAMTLAESCPDTYEAHVVYAGTKFPEVREVEVVKL